MALIWRILLTGIPQAALLLLSSAAFAEDWTRFRGPNGSGVSQDAGFPAEFGPGESGKTKNTIWRTPVRPGKSSPVLTRRHIFLTAFEKGRLFTQCFDRKTGKLLWERSIDRTRDEVVNALNHPAAVTPATDGENIYVFFKDLGLISYDPAGNVRWKTPLGPFSNIMGLGASPIVAGDSVVLLVDQEDDSFIAAFDVRNGEIRWKTARTEAESWGTPLFYSPPGAAPQILTTSRGLFGSYLLSSGKRTVSQSGVARVVVASPVLDRDTVYVFGYGSETGSPFTETLKKYDKNQDGQLTPDEYGNDPFVHGIGKYVGNRDGIVTKEEWDEKQREIIGPNMLMALRLERDSGAPPEKPIRPRELWRYERSFTGVIPSPIVYDGILYFVKNGGILTAIDATTGTVFKTGRVQGALGGYSASPVAADGKLFLANEDGKVAVLRPGRDWDVLTINDLGEGCYATPALSEGHIYLRTSEALYRFGITPR
jgi:outer membrane protein assembly factor BamB